MDPDSLLPETAAGQPEFKPPEPGGSPKASKRRSNHIVRHYRDQEPVIPVSSRVAKPVTVKTTPEQARQAAEIAAGAFKPIVPAPSFPTSTPLDGQNGQIGGVALDASDVAAEPKSHKALLAVLIIFGVIVVAAIAGAVGYYVAKR